MTELKPIIMRTIFFLFFFTLAFSITCQEAYYYPERGSTWKQKSARALGTDQALLDEAIRFAQAHEYTEPHDIRRAILKSFAHEPFHTLLGPTRQRGEPAGMILKKGYLLASWGDTRRVDMTFSVTKSYLSTLAGLALEDGVIEDLDDPVKKYIWDGKFDSPHNAKITWSHLLNQSSDWSGQLWGGYDWADRPPKEGGLDDWKMRKLNEPGTTFEYNDVRVNLLAYCLLNMHRKPLPMVLKERIMDPIGASSTWRWYGYHNSWVNIDGIKMQSVSGGGHSGGGLFINTEDHARFGLLFLSKGQWDGKTIFDPQWIDMMTHPSPSNSNYGYMWWLNPDGTNQRMSHLPSNAYFAAGFGGNYIIVIPDHDIVIVARWLDPRHANEFLGKVLQAIK